MIAGSIFAGGESVRSSCRRCRVRERDQRGRNERNYASNFFPLQSSLRSRRATMLSRAGSEEREEPVPKRARFFPPTQAQPEKVDSNSEDDLIVVAPPVASCAAQITPPRTEGLQESKRVPVDWNEREFAGQSHLRFLRSASSTQSPSVRQRLS